VEPTISWPFPAPEPRRLRSTVPRGPLAAPGAPERAAQGVGRVLVGRLLDQPAPQPSRPRLRRAVAADVDPSADAAGAGQLAARGDLLDGRELAAQERARLARGVRAQVGDAALEDGERVVERVVTLALDGRAVADRDAERACDAAMLPALIPPRA
jgi:hypothetical protein